MATIKKPDTKRTLAKKAAVKKPAVKVVAKAVKKTAKPATAKVAKKITAVSKKPTVVAEKTTKQVTAAKGAGDKKVVHKPTVTSELVKKYRANVKDTGSVAVQIALLTDRIKSLTKHLNKHIHDSDSKRGLLIAVGKRRRLLNYLREHSVNGYAKLIKDLKLKK